MRLLNLKGEKRKVEVEQTEETTNYKIAGLEKELVNINNRLRKRKELSDEVKQEAKNEIKAIIQKGNDEYKRMEQEVLGLETRKQEALKPLEGLRQHLDNRGKELDELEDTLNERDNHYDKKLTELGVLESKLKDYQELIDKERDLNSKDRDEVHKGKYSLTKSIEDFANEVEKFRIERTKKIEDLDNKLARAKKREDIASNRVKICKEEMDKVEADKQKIYSQQQTIKANFQELKQLKK